MSGNCGFGTFAHELNHALGIAHEQSRSDRDNYVTINYNNLKAADLRRNLDKEDTKIFFDYGPYDYKSIMHYPAYISSWSKNPEIPLIVPKNQNLNIRFLGQRRELSDGDIQTICKGLYADVKPNITISSPSNNDNFPSNGTIQFFATIIDQLGIARSTTARLVSNRDGVLKSVTYPLSTPIALNNLSQGTHILSLETQTNCTNNSATIQITVGTTNQAPIAALTATPTSGTAPLAVNFDATGSTDDKGITKYVFDFADGKYNNS